MDVCYKNINARRIAKRCKTNVAKTLVEMLRNRFQNVQDNVKQSEITHFNTMSIKPDETTGSFIDRIIEQAEKLGDMGEEVSDTRKMTRVKEGLALKYLQLAHSLAMQSDLDWAKMEALVRAYEHSIFAQPPRKTEDDGKVLSTNMAFTKKMRGRDKTTKTCRVCRKPGHLAKDCWERNRKPGGNKGPKGKVEKSGNVGTKGKESRMCYVCGKLGHIARDCHDKVTKTTQEENDSRKRKFPGDGNNTGEPTWYTRGTKSYQTRNTEDEDSDAANMFTEVKDDSDKEYTKNYLTALYDDSLIMNYAESSEPFGEDEMILVDSACNVLAINKERLFSNLDKSKTRKIKTAQKKTVVHVKGVGDVGPLTNAYWCPESSENLVGVNILKEMGYMVILDDFCTIVDKVTDATVVQTAAINGIYVIYLNQLILLQELKLEQNLKMNAAIEEEDELKLLHERTGHINC